MLSKGYLYIAAGESHIKKAIKSAYSLTACLPSPRITLISDRKVKYSHPFENIIVKDKSDMISKKGIFKGKVLHISLTPYEKTLYLDTDTWFLSNPEGLFNLLNYTDMAMAPAPGEIDIRDFNSEKVIEGAVPLNCGVILFKTNSEVFSLFKKWAYYYNRQVPGKGILYNKKKIVEQPSFMYALLNSKVKLIPLNHKWNARIGGHFNLNGQCVILHGKGNEKQMKKIEYIINKTTSNRNWCPIDKRVCK